MKFTPVLSLFVFQVLATAFFVIDIASAFIGYAPLTWQVHELVEIAVALGLFASILFSGWVLVESNRRTKRAEEALRLASGALQDVISEKFDQWALTPAERDVALFVIKGMGIAEIAQLRQTSEGTVKAQTNAIYRKSGVANRAQLVSHFVEELMGDGIVPAARPGASAQ